MQYKKTKNDHQLSGILFLTGSVIGAGFFALPYLIGHIGLVTGIGTIITIGCLVIILHLLLAQVALSLPGHKTIVGMGRALLPSSLATTTAVVSIMDSFFAILLFSILGGSFLHALLTPLFPTLHIVWSTFAYVCAISTLTISRISRGQKVDTYIVMTLLVGVCIIAIFALFRGGSIVSLPILSPQVSLLTLGGVTLLGLTSLNSIPLIHHTCGNSPATTSRVIAISGVLVIILALVMVLATLSISGIHVSPESITGIRIYGSKTLGVFASLMGLCAVFSSHVPIAQHVRSVLVSDAHTDTIRAWRTITALPFLIYLYFDPSIINLLGIMGGLLVGLLAMLICLMYIRLHHYDKKTIHIQELVGSGHRWAWIIFVLSGVGVLHQVITLMN